ncbi:MAG: hypothetical protein IJR44_00145, partial [Neisseriaceae bacterium]|nr:hypothetical protein [Neisseriaceae bacterium]
ELPPFALHQESQENIQRVNQLQKIASAISKEYQHKRFQAASELAEELLEKAEHGFFKELAQSWLFRCKAHQEQSFDLTLSKYEVPVEDLENLYQSAQEIEKQKNFALAKTHYEQLVRISKFSQYEMKGQAGIYRTSLAIKED